MPVNLKLAMPAIVFSCSYVAALTLWSAEHVPFLLEAVGIAAFVGCIVVVVRLLPRRRDPSVRVPLVLTATVLLLWLSIALIGFIGSFSVAI